MRREVGRKRGLSTIIILLASMVMLQAVPAQADFRKALEAMQNRDGATMLAEVRDAVEKRNDDGLLLFLNALVIDDVTSRKKSIKDDYQKKIDHSKMISTFETILSESQQQDIKGLLNDAVKNSTVDAQFRLLFMPKFIDKAGEFFNRQKELEKIAHKGSYSAAAQLAQNYSYFYGNPAYSREKAEYWFLKAAELGDPEYTFALAMRYLNYSTPYWVSHEQCTSAVVNKAVCFNKDEKKGFFWLEKAAKNNDKHPQFLRRFAYEMGNIHLAKFDTKDPDYRQAYLWYLLGIKSPKPANVGPEDNAFLTAFTNMYISGELGRVAPELDVIWKDTEKRDEFLYVKNMPELPSFHLKTKEQINVDKPVFSYESNTPIHYFIDVYADGSTRLQLNNVAPEASRDVYLQVPPPKVREFLKKLHSVGINHWQLNNPIKKESNYLCEGGASYCPTNDYFISVYQNSAKRTIYFGDVRRESQIDSKNLLRMAKVFALVEEYFPTQKLRCGLGNSNPYNQECIQQDKLLIQLAKNGDKK